MAHTPTGVKQVQSVLRKEIDDFSLVLGGRSSNSFGKRVSAETTWNLCIGA
jgi:hypothetical protein